MGEQEHAVATEESRSVDHVGVALTDQLDQLREFLGRVLEVGVLNHHQIAIHGRKPPAERCALAGVRLPEQPERELSLQGVQNLPRSVGRSVVDDDELDAERDGQHPANDVFDRGTLVEHRHDDREERIGGNRVARA